MRVERTFVGGPIAGTSHACLQRLARLARPFRPFRRTLFLPRFPSQYHRHPLLAPTLHYEF